MINWKIRFKNPVFLFQFILAVFLPILAYAGLTFKDVTTWAMLWLIILNAGKSPYVLMLIIASVWHAVNDPTTKGFSDSARAMQYSEPKQREGK
jgi:phi LC3 family holin